jgi:hypothetical protein
MPPLRLLPVVLLALAAATAGTYAWQQRAALRTARAQAEALEKERADLRKRLWDAERRRGELEAQLAGRPAGAPAEPGAAPAFSAEEFALDALTRGGGGPEGGRAGRFFALLDDPEVQRLASIQQRAALDERFAALFRNLNLSPQQLEKFKDLLVEKRAAVADVMAAARAEGMTGRENRDELRALVQNAQAEVDGSIRALLGETGFQQYEGYEQTLPQRNTVERLGQRLSYTGAPLSAAQTEQLVQVLATNPGERPPGSRTNVTFGGPGVRVGLGGAAGGAPISDQAVAQAATVLQPTQLQALQQLQQEQQAQAQLGQLVREQMRPRRETPAPSAPPKG